VHTHHSRYTGEGFKEAVSINKSLSALLDVIDALAKQKDSSCQTAVPYRAHPLTLLMSDSLGGNAKTLMFVNISPASSNVDESRGALGYAARAATIQNAIRKDTTTRSDKDQVAELKSQIVALRKELAGKP
jgi:kinesin family protein C2/C3